MRFSRLLLIGGLGGLGTLGACDDPLTVVNENSPDVARSLATPAGIEGLLAASFREVHNGTYGSGDAVWPQTMVMAFESYGSVANFGMGLRGGLPRIAIDNNRGNATAVGNLRDFSQMQRQARNIANGIRALDGLIASGGTISGTPATGGNATDRRARAFGFLTLGIALGNVSLVYDSAAIITPQVASSDVPGLSGFAAVNAAALRMLDSSIAVATAAPAFTIPGADPTWLRGTQLNNADLVRVARSYKARFRAGVARTPTERGAVNWQAVIDDATAGIVNNLNVDISNANGWLQSFVNTAYQYGGWSQIPYFFIGMADTTGAYQQWLATPLLQRTPFAIVSGDRRLPRGTTRAEQVAVTGNTPQTAPSSPTQTQYFLARPVSFDTPGEAWANSYYDHYRFLYFRQGNQNGVWPTMTRAEMDLLAAEGFIRTNRIADAARLIDISRTRNGLPALSGVITTLDQPVPGSAAGCVPKVPAGPNFATATCGNILEALKYEKRLETAFTGYNQFWTDSRGWGDLAQGTPLQWPVPFNEMDSRFQPFYNSNTAAPRGTYGL
ncbi:MAG: RagB/SusD family nutrient uptake outer membrane protein [Gemmatimonadaceae bacterium]|nr:RagB/SusD family nutrient uptake outer membrane protein [Gemmatimonadaceae bacterium]